MRHVVLLVTALAYVSQDARADEGDQAHADVEPEHLAVAVEFVEPGAGQHRQQVERERGRVGHRLADRDLEHGAGGEHHDRDGQCQQRRTHVADDFFIQRLDANVQSCVCFGIRQR